MDYDNSSFDSRWPWDLTHCRSNLESSSVDLRTVGPAKTAVATARAGPGRTPFGPTKGAMSGEKHDEVAVYEVREMSGEKGDEA
jgi:hypothetical protein